MAGTKLRIARETRLEVTTKRGAWVEPEQMLRQIARGGFDARRDDVRMVLTGTLRVGPAGPELALDGPGAAPHVLLVAEPGREKQPKAAGGFRLADAAGHAGATVEVEGLWRPIPAAATSPPPLAPPTVALAVISLRDLRPAPQASPAHN